MFVAEKVLWLLVISLTDHTASLHNNFPLMCRSGQPRYRSHRHLAAKEQILITWTWQHPRSPPPPPPPPKKKKRKKKKEKEKKKKKTKKRTKGPHCCPVLRGIHQWSPYIPLIKASDAMCISTPCYHSFLVHDIFSSTNYVNVLYVKVIWTLRTPYNSRVNVCVWITTWTLW